MALEIPKSSTPTTFPPPNVQSKNVSVVTEPAKDFNEDPFKNYRYEDPFLISDPFQDEETPPAVTKGKTIIYIYPETTLSCSFESTKLLLNLKFRRFTRNV